MSRPNPIWPSVLLIVLLSLSGWLPTAPGSASAGPVARRAAAVRAETPGPAEKPGETPADPPPFDPPQPTPGLALTLTADPSRVAAGGVVTLTAAAANRGDLPLAGVALTVTLPAGLAYEPGSAQGLAYDAASGQLTATLPGLAAGAAFTTTFRGRPEGVTAGTVLTTTLAGLAEGFPAPVTAAAAVTVVPEAADTVWVTPEEGGWLRSTDGRLELRVPPGAVATRTRITYAPQTAAPRPPPRLQLAFRLEAAEESGQVRHRFSAPAVLTLTYRAEEWPALAGAPVLYSYDEAGKTWITLPAQVAPAERQVQAAIQRLALYAAASGDGFVPEVMPTIRGIQSDLFTASASVTYDIPLPSGRGGLVPALAVQFNSRDRQADPGHSSVLGTGWRMTADSFIWWNRSEPGTAPATWRIAGVTYSERGGPHGRADMYLQEAPGWRLVEPRDAYAPDGTHYHFEEALSDWWCDGTTIKARADKWVLQYVVDPLGNRIDYLYDVDLLDGDPDSDLPVSAADVKNNKTKYQDALGRLWREKTFYCDGDETVAYLSQINLRQIRYNGGQTVVELSYAARDDAPLRDPDSTADWAYYTTRLLTGIRLRQAGSLVAGYKVTYDHWGAALPDSRRYALNGIARCSDEGLTQCLPAWTFTNNMGYGNGYLSRVDNGYGGQVAFGYGADWNVTTRTVTDQVTAATHQWNYSYSDKLLDGYTVVGYAQVTETLPSGLGAGNTIYHHFINGNGPDVGFRGKEDRQLTTVGGVKQQEILRTWTGVTAGVYGGAKLVYLSTERQLIYDQDGLNPLARRTVYYYDLDHQGNAQYGNLTRRLEYSDDGATLYRTIERWFYPRDDVANGKYIVNRVGQEKLWDGGGGCQGQTRTIYDTTGFNQHQTPPTQGLPREVWQAVVCDGASQGAWVRRILNAYDGYGNLTSTTAANGAVTHTTYDPTFGVYPLSVTVTAGPGGGTPQTTAYTYYGINAEVGGSGLTGQLQRTSDPNNALTRFSYDAFGRPTARRRPDAAFGHPATEQYAYTDSIPFTVRHGVRDDSNGDFSSAATYLEDWTFYDGLGQVIQTQAESATPDQSRIAHTAYDALGRAVQQTRPAFYPAAPGVYRPPAGADWAGRTTTTSYDALGRVTAVTQPDGTAVRSFYHGRRTAVLDANNHQTLQEADAFGRLIGSRQYEGVFAQPGWGAAPYAWATYAYNVRDQLTDLWDTAGHRTAIGYDLLGRKTSLSDPDMGAWSYAYDPAGNLVRQTDARNQTTCFYYDGLNRLKGKSYRGDPGCPTADPGSYAVSYGYDSTAGGNQGVGRRTSMTTTGAAANSAAWVYDARGRATSETRTSGGVAYTTGYAYDSADRVRTQTYPDGEAVATAYDGQGLPASLAGSATYVSATTYDAAGRADVRTLGGGLATDYDYYPWTQSGGRLQRLRTGSVQDLRYAQYDAVGNVQQIVDQLAGQTQNFSYDALDRLTAAAATGGSAGVYSESYGYAPTGNLTSKAGAAYTYADAAHVHAVTHVGGAPKACYDQNGNQTVRLAGDTLHVLAYDAENRLVAVSKRSNLTAVIGRSGSAVTLSWAAASGATAYEVWRGTTPYFTPGASGSVKATTTTATSYSDPGRSGDPATNYYYLIIATASGCPLGVSQRVGEFDFALTPGALAGVAAVRTFEAEAETKTLSLNLDLNLVDTPIASFTYDADGQRISATVDGVTTVYPFAHYEVEGTTVRKYYLIGGQRVAMRTNGVLSYLLTDHLGSTAVTTDAAGVKAGELRYLPFGATRTTWGVIPTERRFTGQPRYATLGLDYFGARWYDPALGRFIQPDTIVPQPGNPQALNRYLSVRSFLGWVPRIGRQFGIDRDRVV